LLDDELVSPRVDALIESFLALRNRFQPDRLLTG
jgi:hypothetical protein